MVAALRNAVTLSSWTFREAERKLALVQSKISPDDSQAIESTTAPGDVLIGFRRVHAMLGLTCKTGHTARALAARGQIRAVRLNERTIRYSEASVLDLIAGRAPVVAAASKPTTGATP